MLARLPFPIYITINPDNLLTAALTEAGRPPDREVFHWRVEDRQDSTDGRLDGGDVDGDPGAIRSPWDTPLVYHLFGHLDGDDNRQRLVLTEDQYFDYLIGATANKNLIPTDVRTALNDRSLLFIGFQMSDWSFRVLLRIIASRSGGRGERHPHVAVQVHPEAGQVEDTEWARKYLEDYFDSARIGSRRAIYWGKSADFLEELRGRWFDTYGAYPRYPIDVGALGDCDCNPVAVD